MKNNQASEKPFPGEDNYTYSGSGSIIIARNTNPKYAKILLALMQMGHEDKLFISNSVNSTGADCCNWGFNIKVHEQPVTPTHDESGISYRKDSESDDQSVCQMFDYSESSEDVTGSRHFFFYSVDLPKYVPAPEVVLSDE